jgi:hypothetical protein
MKVVELVMAQRAHGWSAEELHFQHPHLSLSQINSALIYYRDHEKEVDADIERRSRFAEEARRENGPSPLVSSTAMDLHRLAEERSIAYHRVIAERLQSQPEILEMARKRVRTWLSSPRTAKQFYAQKWAEILAGDVPSIAAFLVERSELAIELRQSTPFAGALKPEERLRIFTRPGTTS